MRLAPLIHQVVVDLELVAQLRKQCVQRLNPSCLKFLIITGFLVISGLHNFFLEHMSNQQRPSILRYFSDQQWWDTFVALGDKFIQTNNLDALISQVFAF